MANELAITGAGDALTVYVVIRRKSDSKVWDVANSTFATWSNGSIADYDTVLSAKSGDLYQGTFPTAIASNTRVLILYYSQAGGTAAITDTLLLTVDTTWNGTELTSASSVSLDSRALTSLNTVKRRLGITASTHDTVLTEFINQASDKIERIIGRRIAASNYNEWLTSESSLLHRDDMWPSGDVNETVRVRNYPVIRVESVRFIRSSAVSVAYSGAAIEATVSVYFDEEGQNGGVRLTSITAAGSETTTDIPFATYPTLSTVATQITTISGWTGTKVPTTDSRADAMYPLSGFDAKSQTGYLEYVSELDSEYDVDHRLGLIRFRSNARRLVKYRGGYATIPDDIDAICAAFVSKMFQSISVNQALASESIPDYSYSVANGVQLAADDLATLQIYQPVSLGGTC